MPIVRKLAPEEVRGIQNKGKSQRKLVEEEYDTFLADYGAGDYGEAVLEESENRLTVRNRLKAAAARRRLKLNFNRTTDNTLRFSVDSSNGTDGQAQNDGQASSAGAMAPPPENDASVMADKVEIPVGSDEMPTTPRRRGGRPKKSA